MKVFQLYAHVYDEDTGYASHSIYIALLWAECVDMVKLRLRGSILRRDGVVFEIRETGIPIVDKIVFEAKPGAVDFFEGGDLDNAKATFKATYHGQGVCG